MDEAERRKLAVAKGQTDLDRWANRDPYNRQQARALLASDLIAAGSRVLDIGAGSMFLENHLPLGCAYQPCDVVARDERTIVLDLNTQAPPEKALIDCDVVVMLGVWEYLFRPQEIFSTLARVGRPIVCSYCPTDLTADKELRRANGWTNDLSLDEFLDLAGESGYRRILRRQIDKRQYLIKLEKADGFPDFPTKRVHVISYNNIGNFGDRLGYHLLNEVVPSYAEVSWGTLKPLTPPPDRMDLVVIGIGNSLFGNLINDALIETIASAKASIGIFGTQYRESLPKGKLGQLIDRLTCWYARYEEDLLLYGRGRENVVHLGDWLVNAFPLTSGTDDRVLRIGKEIWKDLPLDRTIQSIQRHRKVFSERVHPLLCALTSAEEVAYKEQRESGATNLSSGKFRSMFMDVFGQTYPEEKFWAVERQKVAEYKARVRRNTGALRRRIEELLR